MISSQIRVKKSKNSLVEILKFFPSIFDWVFTNRFLDIHNISNLVLYLNNPIQAKNVNFGDTHPPRFGILWYPLKITKIDWKSPKMPFWTFWWAGMTKITANHVWNMFWDVSGQKVLIKKNFSFSPRKTMIFQKKISKGSKSIFLSSETWLDGFSMKF